MTEITLVDNYDSFTWNLYHELGKLGANVAVVRNDEITADALIARRPDGIVLSPGPCTPTEAGICLDVISKAAADIPLFGVCLGLQAMGQAFGGEVVRAPVPMHGKVSTIHHKGQGVFRGINGMFRATRYHSLIVRRDTFPDDLVVTAESEDGLVMGLSHKHLPLHGVQFHPESILSEHGLTIFKNFLDLASEWNKTRRVPAVA
jgi:anthranilate synthase component 2